MGRRVSTARGQVMEGGDSATQWSAVIVVTMVYRDKDASRELDFVGERRGIEDSGCLKRDEAGHAGD